VIVKQDVSDSILLQTLFIATHELVEETVFVGKALVQVHQVESFILERHVEL